MANRILILGNLRLKKLRELSKYLGILLQYYNEFMLKKFPLQNCKESLEKANQKEAIACQKEGETTSEPLQISVLQTSKGGS